MGEWAQLANTTGVALAVLAAVGVAIWRLGKLLSHKFLGNPDSNPPQAGLIDVYLGQQNRFFQTIEGHTAHQQTLCERHASALEMISTTLLAHDGLSVGRYQAIDELVKNHTDPTIPNSTAKAIVTVEAMRKAALQTCSMCRELDHGDNQNKVQVHCDAIERILKGTEGETG